MSDEYVPSAKDAPDGPRNNRDELEEIRKRTDEFASSTTDERYGEAVEDPFSKENAPAFTLVTLMRLYDVGMALLNEKNSEVAARLHEVHSQGKLVGSFPWINAEDE